MSYFSEQKHTRSTCCSQTAKHQTVSHHFLLQQRIVVQRLAGWTSVLTAWVQIQLLQLGFRMTSGVDRFLNSVLHPAVLT